MRNKLVTLGLFVALVVCPALATAQEAAPDPFKTAKYRLGPIAFNPSIGITNVGVDTNVFYEWENPKSDFTTTIAPGTELLFRAGPTMLKARADVWYVYYATYTTERAWNGKVSARYDVNWLHVRPYALLSYSNTYQRAGYDVDVRARQHQQNYGLGVDVPVSTRTIVGVVAQQLRESYPGDVQYGGAYLRALYSRNENSVQASASYKVTPLTTLVLDVNTRQDRFTYTADRNSNSFSVMPGVNFDAFAIVQGSARVGYKQFNVLDSKVADYSGVVATVNLGYTLAGVTRFSVAVNRDVNYSYEIAQPYYVLTGATLTVTQKVAGPFDAQARGGLQHLAYVAAAGQTISQGTTEDVRTYGGGVGYHLGRTARLGFNVDSERRTSPFDQRQYSGLRIYTSMTFGQQ